MENAESSHSRTGVKDRYDNSFICIRHRSGIAALTYSF